MIYQKFMPSPVLEPFVECYFVWHSSGESVSGMVVESPPSGYCSIVFNCGDSYVLHNKKYDRLSVPRCFISGQSIYSYSLLLDGVINIIGIVLKPTALASLFGLPTFQYTEERISLDTVFKKPTIDRMFAEICNTDDPKKKVRVLDDFMISQYDERKPETDYIDQTANMIIEKNGMLDVSQMMENVFMSRRNFERRFFKKVGLSPKYYARLRRIGYVMRLIAGKREADWGSIFSTCEFYDQSHFIKDFMEFTGRTPEHYLKENAELANLVEKPRPDSL